MSLNKEAINKLSDLTHKYINHDKYKIKTEGLTDLGLDEILNELELSENLKEDISNCFYEIHWCCRELLVVVNILKMGSISDSDKLIYLDKLLNSEIQEEIDKLDIWIKENDLEPNPQLCEGVFLGGPEKRLSYSNILYLLAITILIAIIIVFISLYLPLIPLHHK